MSQKMSIDQLCDLYEHVADHHGISNRHGLTVKYLDPHIDMRDGQVFYIGIRGYDWEEFFHTQNECRDLPESLFDRVMTFIDKEAL